MKNFKIKKRKTESLDVRGIYYIVFLTMVVFFISIVVFSYCNRYFIQADVSFVITSVKDVFNIFFFGGVLIVTVLSYIQAKKTLFTPIKTETFKIQIKMFEDIILFFQNKGETDFTAQFDFDKILSLNASLLLFDFIKHFYKKEIKLNEEKIEELHSEFYGAIVSKKFAEKFFSEPSFFEVEDDKAKEEDEITNPAIILKEWEEYEYGKINFTKQYSDELERLNNLIASPLIPEQLKSKLITFEEKVSNNLHLVGDCLTDIAKEMPKRFPTAKSTEKFNMIGVWNKYNSDRESVEADAKEILSYIRDYLRIEELID